LTAAQVAKVIMDDDSDGQLSDELTMHTYSNDCSGIEPVSTGQDDHLSSTVCYYNVVING